MSQDSFASEATATTTTATTTTATSHKPSQSSLTDYSYKIQSAIQSLSSITTIPPSLISSQDPAFSLLHDPHVSSQISSLLRHPDSGAGDNNLCRWFYDTFQSTSPQLQLVVLRFLPIIAGLYLSRVPLRKPLAGFEAVLLALYAHETTSRNGQAITVNIPDLSNSSVYHETKEASRNNSTDLNLAVISPSLEPHGTVRSTRRARIVGVALELYFSKISLMPVGSKIDFCEFCEVWAGQEGDMYKENLGGGENGDSRGCGDEEGDSSGGGGEEGESSGGGGKEGESSGGGGKEGDSSGGGGKEGESSGGGGKEGDSSGGGGGGGGGGSVYEEKGKKEGRIPLPWELLQPALRILGHCLLGPNKDKELSDAACVAIRSLYARSLHDINPKAILATGSLLRLSKIGMNSQNEIDYTEISMTDVISL